MMLRLIVLIIIFILGIALVWLELDKNKTKKAKAKTTAKVFIGIFIGVLSGLLFTSELGITQDFLLRAQKEYVSEEYDKSFQYLEQAVSNGDYQAASILGYIYLKPDQFGNYVARDLDKSKGYFEQAYQMSKRSLEAEKYYDYILALYINEPLPFTEFGEIILMGYRNNYSNASRLLSLLMNIDETGKKMSEDEMFIKFSEMNQNDRLDLYMKCSAWNYNSVIRSETAKSIYADEREKQFLLRISDEIVDSTDKSIVPKIIPYYYYIQSKRVVYYDLDVLDVSLLKLFR